MGNPSSDSGWAEQVADLVAEAFEREPDQRAAFLRDACSGNEALRAEVQSLLDQEAGAKDLLGLLSAPIFASANSRLFGSEPGELQPGDTLGDCRIIRFLGEGGTGEVYLARDTRLERDVAVKLLKRQFDEGQLLRRFHHERRVLAALTHPGIARLYGGEVTPEGRSYLVMEYVEGKQLDRYCDQAGLGATGRLELFRKVCAAVAYAHQNLIVHRDLKPANIRVTAGGEPKLLDFGIAKLLETESAEPEANPTLTVQAMMTPEYASPEQLRGESITTAGDVYSLGVVLYELLCGQRPFAHLKGRRPDELARAICEEEPPRPSKVIGATSSASTTTTRSADPASSVTTTSQKRPATLRRQLEGDLDNIVAKALQKEPARRYASVLAFSEDLRRHCEGLPVRARRDTAGYRTGKFVRRNKTAVAAAVLVLLALVGGLVLATWQAHLASQERDRARAALESAQIARHQAESSKAQSERLNDFLQRLLTSPSPQEMGKDVKVLEVLDAASWNVDRDLATEPEVLAQVHRSLGTAYINLGMLDPGETQMRAALALFQRLHGDDDAASIVAKYRLAYVLLARKRPAEAEPLLRAVLRWQRQQSPPDLDALVKTLDRMSTLCTMTNQLGEAESAVAEMRVLTVKAHGERSLEYVHVLNSLAGVKRAEGDYAGTAQVARQAVDLCDKLPGNVLIHTIAPEMNLSMALFALGRKQEFLLALARAERDVRVTVGERSSYYGGVVALQAMSAFTEAEYERTISEARRALELLGPMYPPEDPFNVTCQAILGLALTRTGHAAEGEPFLQTALADGKNVEQIYFPVTIGNLEAALGECLLTLKRYPEAEELLLTGYDKLQARPDSPDALTEATCHRLHDLYAAWNKPGQAARFAGKQAVSPETQVP